MLRLTGVTCHGPLCVTAKAGWWITQGFRAQLHGLGQICVFDLLVAICVGRHSLDGIRQVWNFEFLSFRHLPDLSSCLNLVN